MVAVQKNTNISQQKKVITKVNPKVTITGTRINQIPLLINYKDLEQDSNLKKRNILVISKLREIILSEDQIF